MRGKESCWLVLLYLDRPLSRQLLRPHTCHCWSAVLAISVNMAEQHGGLEFISLVIVFSVKKLKIPQRLWKCFQRITI